MTAAAATSNDQTTSSIGQTARSLSQVHKWWASKIAPLLAVTYVALILDPLAIGAALTRGATMLWSACLLASAAYVVNDWYDREVDRAAGKESFAIRAAPATILGIYVALVAAAVVPWFVVGLPPSGWGAMVAIIVLPLVYSAPPLRWKVRGGLGLIADAGLAHVSPTVFALAAFGALELDGDAAASATALAAVLWSIGLGLRSIIAHEISDLASDQAAGVETWVGAVGVDRASWVATRLIFPIEVVGLVAMPIALASVTPVPAVLLAIAGIAVVAGKAAGAFPIPWLVVSTQQTERFVLFMFYRFWLGSAFLAGLVVVDRSFAVLVPIHILLFWPIAVAEVRTLLHSSLGTVRGLWWLAYNRVIHPTRSWLRYRLPENTRILGRWIAARWSTFAMAMTDAWRATIDGIARLGPPIGRAFATVGRAFAAVGRGVGRAVGTGWRSARRFVWRAYRKVRRTVLGGQRSRS